MKIQKMTKTKIQIIEELAKNRTVETLISNIVKNKWNDTYNDLAQMIYEDLLTKKNENLIQKLYQNQESNNELNAFLIRMIVNNIFSKNSPFYYQFGKYRDMVGGEHLDLFNYDGEGEGDED